MKVWIFWEIGMGGGAFRRGVWVGVCGWCVGGILAYLGSGCQMGAELVPGGLAARKLSADNGVGYNWRERKSI